MHIRPIDAGADAEINGAVVHGSGDGCTAGIGHIGTIDEHGGRVYAVPGSGNVIPFAWLQLTCRIGCRPGETEIAAGSVAADGQGYPAIRKNVQFKRFINAIFSFGNYRLDCPECIDLHPGG